MISVLLALGASVSWGISDFLGGLNSRFLAVATVMLVSQAVGLALLMPLALLHGWPPFDGVSYAYAAAGRTQEARAALNQLHALSKQKYVSPYDLAMVHVGLEEIDEAFAWLDRQLKR